MGKKRVFLIALIIIILLGLGVIIFGNSFIKKAVAKKLSEEFNLEFASLDASLWNRSITVDSIHSFLNNGSIAKAKLEELNWISLFFDRQIDLDDVCFTLTNFSTLLADGFHRVQIDSLSKRRGDIHLVSLKLTSPYSDTDFHKKSKFRRSKIALDVPNLYGNGFSAESNQISAIKIPSFALDVDENLNVPLDGNKRKLPGEILKDIGTPFLIKDLLLEDGRIDYAVIDQGSTKKGSIALTNVKLQGSNVSSDSTDLEMILEMDSYISGAPLKVVTRNFMNHPEYKYDLYVSIQEFDFRDLNSLTEPSKGITITSGQVNELVMEGSFDDSSAQGTVKIDYENLKVDMNKKLAGIANFLSNAAIKDSGDEEIQFSNEREQEKGFLIHITSSLKKALREIITLI